MRDDFTLGWKIILEKQKKELLKHNEVESVAEKKMCVRVVARTSATN